MKIALTGGAGGIGRAITARALADGHTIVSFDRAPHPDFRDGPSFTFVQGDISDYELMVKSFAGCDTMIHMAAIPSPFTLPDHVVHNNNVVGSYNALRAAAEHGIMRVCQASSVNAIGHSYSRNPNYDYFPLDEEHPTYNEEPYGLSKWICELQAETFVRRYGMTIASMRFHWVVTERAVAAVPFNEATELPGKHLWAYTRFDAAVDACLLSLTADFTGHEAFFIVAPDTTSEIPSRELVAKWFPGTPIKGEFAGNASLFNSAKAERMLGWKHNKALGS